MKLFTQLFLHLDQSTKEKDKIAALAAYLEKATESDKLWAIALFCGKKPPRLTQNLLLKTWAFSMAELPVWLWEESYAVTGDWAETIALVLPPPQDASDQSLASWMENLMEISDKGAAVKKAFILDSWSQLHGNERWVFNKLITGSFRPNITQRQLVLALAQHSGLERNAISHRLLEAWDPQKQSFQELLFSENEKDDISRPFPFSLSTDLEEEVESLGDPAGWQVEWLWEGIGVQIILREGACFLWSKEDDLISHKIPELQRLLKALPDGSVIEGSMLAWKEGMPLPFSVLQSRLNKKNIPAKVVKEVPVHFIAHDLLEMEGQDIREKPLVYRREKLVECIERADLPDLISLSEVIEFEAWPQLAELRAYARDFRSLGFMLRHKDSPYAAGRQSGRHWSWKADPMRIVAVLIYAERGRGAQAKSYSSYTLAVWKEEELVPLAKADKGLQEEEVEELEQWIKAHTLERFGPVRSVQAELVFELAFEGIEPSKRRKSGVVLHQPRILRWVRDKKAAEADSLEEVERLLGRLG